MGGQVSLEFLIVLAAYTALLFLLISAFANFFIGVRSYGEGIHARARSQLLAALYSLRVVNGAHQSLNVSTEGCIITEEEVICGKIVTKRQIPRAHKEAYGYESV